MSCRRAIFPSLHHRKEGWLRHQENFAKRPKQTQPGWFSFLLGKPPRPRCQWMLRGIFLLARPPLLAVMQGGECRSPATHSRLVRAFPQFAPQTLSSAIHQADVYPVSPRIPHSLHPRQLLTAPVSVPIFPAPAKAVRTIRSARLEVWRGLLLLPRA